MTVPAGIEPEPHHGPAAPFVWHPDCPCRTCVRVPAFLTDLGEDAEQAADEQRQRLQRQRDDGWDDFITALDGHGGPPAISLLYLVEKGSATPGVAPRHRRVNLDHDSS